MWKKEFNLFVMLSCAFGLAWALTGEASAVEAMRVSAFGVATASTDAGPLYRVRLGAPRPGAWSGLRLDFPAPRDLSSVGLVRANLTNETDRSVRVYCKLRADTLQGRIPECYLDLPPNACRMMSLPIFAERWMLDRDLGLKALKRGPGVGKVASYDVTKTRGFVFYTEPSVGDCAFGVSNFTLVSSDGLGGAVQLKADSFLPWVDGFGQGNFTDWRGKVHSVDDLKAAAMRETAELSSSSPGIPQADRFGGWAGGPKLKATGFFRTEKVGVKWWLVDPDGHLFFSHGVDVVNDGEVITAVGFRERYFEWLPAKDDARFGVFWDVAKSRAAHGFYAQDGHFPYARFDFGRANMLRKYGAEWRRISSDLTHRRLRAWGLNTIGNWSQPGIYGQGRTPYVLRLGTWGTPRRAGSEGWWGPLPDPFNPAFERIFRDRVREFAKTMREDPWCVGAFVDNELSWDNLPDVAEVAEKYFAVVSSVLHDELPNHLYLGCRIAWGSDAVYRASAKYCDVVSVNLYDRQPTRDLPAGSVDRPMINGEFHCGALDRGLFHTGLVATGSQAERAQCYRDFLNGCLDHPRMIGTHWFQWRDQAVTGRDDGENYQIGFVTIADAPYPELVAAAREIAAGMYRRRYEGRKGAR